MQEPQVKAGILASEKIVFTLTGLYTLPDGELVEESRKHA